MGTSDLQRMHQDEWLSELRMAEGQGRGPIAMRTEPHCALGVAFRMSGVEYRTYVRGLSDWLGISHELLRDVWRRNDGATHVPPGGYVGPRQSFNDIADWFKAERDACGGDLSEWPGVGNA